MDTKQYYELLTKLITDADEDAGKWDGDNPGRGKDIAHVANDISDKAKELSALLNEYSQL